jgi:hypothetical protein
MVTITRCMPQHFVTYGSGTRYSVIDTVHAIRRGFMLDLTGIMLSSVLMLIVIVQAVRRDRIQPWFQAFKPKPKPVEDTTQSWRRRH